MASTDRKIFDAWEIASWMPPPEESVDEWAERCIVLPPQTPIPGPLNLDRTPHLRQPMRDATDPDVEEVTLCFSTQTGKTLILMCVLLYYLFRDPKNSIHVMPREEDAQELNLDRYQEYIRASPSLAAQFSGRKHEMTRDAIRAHGCTLRFATAQSAAALASRSAGRIACDETDKWGTWTGGEAPPFELVRERTVNFHDRVIYDASTPIHDDGHILSRLKASDNQRYRVPCPHCGHYQELILGTAGEGTPGIKWPKGARPEEIVAKQLAWYECVECHEQILQRHRPEIMRRGVWVPAGCDVDEEGNLVGDLPLKRHRGYHCWAIYSHSPKRTFSHIAAEFMQARLADGKLMNFYNSWLARGWRRVVDSLADDILQARKGDYVKGEVPDGVWVILAAIDVQGGENARYFWYLLRGWGMHGESWLITWGRVDTWEGLYDVLFHSEYRKKNGDPIPVFNAFVDSGYKAPEVYEFCQEVGAIAIKGDRKIAASHKWSKGRASKRTIRLLLVDTDHYKDMVHRQIRHTREGSKGKRIPMWHLPADIDDEYFSHMRNEQLVQETDKKTGKTKYTWKLKTDHAPNHAFDCEQYNAAGADVLKLLNRARAPQFQSAKERRPAGTTIVIEERHFS